MPATPERHRPTDRIPAPATPGHGAAEQLLAELTKADGAFQRAKQSFERAKAVSRETLEMTVCR
jgi:hypothetical protein